MNSSSSGISVNMRSRSKRYMLGLGVLSLVVFLWVGSSVLIQEVFEDLEFDSPYFLTYFSTSLFSLYLIPVCGRGLCQERLRCGATVSSEQFWDVFRVSSILCPVFFVLNYFFNLSLTMTSVSSNTIISSTSCLFVLFLSKVFVGKNVKRLNLFGCLVTITGAALIAFRDTHHDDSATDEDSNLLGDIFVLLSAFFYGLYAILLELKVGPDEDNFDMVLMFGLLGLINLIILWPGMIVLHVIGIETFHIPPAKVFLMLLLNGIFGTVISDFLYAQAVLMTSPLIATLGLTFTIPLAMISDIILHGRAFTWMYFLGSLLVFVGFLLVNWESSKDAQARQVAAPMEASDDDEDATDDARLPILAPDAESSTKYSA